MARDYQKLEDYGLIGNLETCALVGRGGSIDWCCFPHLESASVFAAILDVEKGGHFQIKPRGHFDSHQSYVGTTNVLATRFETASGVVSVTDFMPLRDKAASLPRAILRKVACDGGKVELAVDFQPRFDYARAIPVLEGAQAGVFARWGDQSLFLQSPFPLELRDGEGRGAFSVSVGESYWFVLQYGHDQPLRSENCESLLDETVRYWSDWAHSCERDQCVFEGPWHDLAVRSGLVLKLLTHPESGAIAAAPTTSLPEEIGGVRNWDYRFAWIRDASFTVQALYHLGHVEEAFRYFRWLRDLCHTCEGYNEPHEIQVLYGLHGEADLEERELNHLVGYRGSAPVRIGNAAVKQIQLDIYGELIQAFYETRRYGEDILPLDWEFIRKTADHVSGVWRTEDSGIWEVRGGPRHFTYSKLMCWVTLDRSIRMAEKWGFEGPLKKWGEVRETIRRAILNEGFSPRLNSFVQEFGSEALDATSLLIPIMGFLPFEDPRVQGTIEATLKHLTIDNLVYRYAGDDGLPGKEGAFLLCSFWLVQALALSGKMERAEEIFLSVIKRASPLGLLAEEFEPVSGEQLGNYPQAFSHIGLINSALYLGRARGKKSTERNSHGS